MERGIIKVSVEGGTLEGLGSACPFYERSYRSDEADTYYGEALAIVRAGSGQTVKVKASDGIHETEVVIPVEKDGQGGEA